MKFGSRHELEVSTTPWLLLHLYIKHSRENKVCINFTGKVWKCTATNFFRAGTKVVIWRKSTIGSILIIEGFVVEGPHQSHPISREAFDLLNENEAA